MCDAALGLRLALPGARRPRGLGTHPRAQGCAAWPRAGLGRGGGCLPGRAGQRCRGFVTRAASPSLAACTRAPGREARSGTSSRSLLDGDTGSLRGHGTSRAAPSRAPCPGPSPFRAAPSPSQGIGVFFFFGCWAGAATELPRGRGRCPALRDEGVAAPAMVTAANRPAPAPIFISPGQTGLLRRLSCCARDGGFIRHAVYTAAGGARGAEPGGFGGAGGQNTIPVPIPDPILVPIPPGLGGFVPRVDSVHRLGTRGAATQHRGDAAVPRWCQGWRSHWFLSVSGPCRARPRAELFALRRVVFSFHPVTAALCPAAARSGAGHGGAQTSPPHFPASPNPAGCSPRGWSLSARGGSAQLWGCPWLTPSHFPELSTYPTSPAPSPLLLPERPGAYGEGSPNED